VSVLGGIFESFSVTRAFIFVFEKFLCHIQENWMFKLTDMYQNEILSSLFSVAINLPFFVWL
jgi:hypothetical protein